jgi:adenylosuccinate lyase
MSEIKNILADRYASPAINDIFSEEGKILTEREFWIAVMKAQKDLGLSIPDEAIKAYERVKKEIDLALINKKEKRLRHDVKAKIETFCELAGYEHIHKGLTSRDLTDNVEQFQFYKALKVIRNKVIRVLQMMAERADEYKFLVIAGKTHNVAAQPTTFGKRIAMFGQELLIALEKLDFVISHYALRGLKGAVGTLLDQQTLFAGDEKKLEKLEELIAGHLGFSSLLNAVGQVYPRSMDYELVSMLVQISAGPSSFCRTLRLMAGLELATEGFLKGQVGSSAMPHKMNSRSCERVNGFDNILKGYAVMVMGLSGDQWNEGDVSCSVVRRVALPDSFFAIDGLLETFMTILKEMGVYPSVIKQELDKYLPFLATTTILMEAVKKGNGRENIHEIIKLHAVSTVQDLREGEISKNDLLKRLAEDDNFPLNLQELERIIEHPDAFVGLAGKQVQNFNQQVQEWVTRFPDAAEIIPGGII